MDVGAAELLGAHHLAGRGLDQRRPAQKDGALSAHDHAFVRHGRNIGAAGRARAHDDGDLRDAGRRQRRLIVEDAAEVLAIRKDLVLVGQIGAAGIHQIDAGQPVLARDLLRPQMLLHGDRKVGAALHGRIIGDHDAFLSLHLPDTGDESSGRNLLAIEAMPGERRELQERRARIEQQADALAREQLAAPHMPLARLRVAALRDAGQEIVERAHVGAQALGIGRKVGAAGIDRCFEDGHFRSSELGMRGHPSSRPIARRRRALTRLWSRDPYAAADRWGTAA